MKRGFTLIELLVVMTVIAILATLALFAVGKTQASARDVKREQIMTGLQATLNRYHGDNDGYYISTSTNKFCAMINNLFTNNYIPARPTDPNGTAICGASDVGDPTVGGATYGYTGTATTYTLTLTKEAGGSVDFLNPQ